MRVPCVASCVAAALVALPGCATITRGTTETLSIQSEPPGASVELSNGQTCRTPCSLEVKRKNEYLVYLRKDGFEPAQMTVTPKVAASGAAGMTGNVLFGGIIGLGVDAATGASKSLNPNPAHVHLRVADPADADRLCDAPGTVAGAACRGLLGPGTEKSSVQALLGPPQQVSRDDHEWKYGHDTLVFDDAGRLANTMVEK